MTDSATATGTDQGTSRRAGALGLIVLAAVVAYVLVRAAPDISRGITDPALLTLLGYLVVWVPLGLGVAVAWRAFHWKLSWRRTFRPIDLLWGLGIGLLTRMVASMLEIIGYGRIGTAPPTFDVIVHNVAWLFVTLVAPVIIAPVVEELYFRGALVRGIERVVPATLPLTRLALPVAISSIVFALLHVVNVASPTELIVVGLSTLIFGIAASCAALATGRIGAPIIAHITFNGLVVVPMVLGF